MADKLLTLEGAQTLYNDLRKRLGVVPADIDTELKKKIDSASVENGYLVLYANGVPVGEPLGPFNGTGTGGGGGGSPAYTTITMKNLSFKDESGIASTSKTLTPGQIVIFLSNGNPFLMVSQLVMVLLGFKLEQRL